MVTVDGTTVTVVLSTDYPGTDETRNGNNFRFQLQFTKDGLTTRQSMLKEVSVTPSSLNVVSSSYHGNVEPGTYRVSVTAVNEHGRPANLHG